MEVDAGFNNFSTFFAKLKGTYRMTDSPSNIATRNNSRGPFLFKCCRVVYNKETNRLELPEEEVVGKDFLRCKEDEEDVEDQEEKEESYLIGKTIYIEREGIEG